MSGKETVPYERATSGDKARAEIGRLLQRFDAESVGFLDDYRDHKVTLQFVYRGQPVSLQASAKGWATLWLQANPWTGRRRYGQKEWEDRALQQGLVAINSILRDWVKGQIMAIESGVLSFHQAFLPYMLTKDGRTVHDHIMERKHELLPAPEAGA